MTTTFEEIIEREGALVYTNVGDSMMPLLRQNRDLVVIVRKPQDRRLRMLDIPLYKRDSGQYVLHRIMWVRKNDYVCCGDNRHHFETGVEDRHIIGILSAVVKDGKEIPVDTREFRVYSYKVWTKCVMKWLAHLPFRIARKIYHIVNK